MEMARERVKRAGEQGGGEGREGRGGIERKGRGYTLPPPFQEFLRAPMQINK